MDRTDKSIFESVVVAPAATVKGRDRAMANPQEIITDAHKAAYALKKLGNDSSDDELPESLQVRTISSLRARRHREGTMPASTFSVQLPSASLLMLHQDRKMMHKSKDDSSSPTQLHAKLWVGTEYQVDTWDYPTTTAEDSATCTTSDLEDPLDDLQPSGGDGPSPLNPLLALPPNDKARRAPAGRTVSTGRALGRAASNKTLRTDVNVLPIHRSIDFAPNPTLYSPALPNGLGRCTSTLLRKEGSEPSSCHSSSDANAVAARPQRLPVRSISCRSPEVVDRGRISIEPDTPACVQRHATRSRSFHHPNKGLRQHLSAQMTEEIHDDIKQSSTNGSEPQCSKGLTPTPLNDSEYNLMSFADQALVMLRSEIQGLAKNRTSYVSTSCNGRLSMLPAIQQHSSDLCDTEESIRKRHAVDTSSLIAHGDRRIVSRQPSRLNRKQSAPSALAGIADDADGDDSHTSLMMMTDPV